MKNLFKLNLFILSLSVVSVLLSILIYFPALRLNFLLIDDGQIIKNSRIIDESLISLDFSKTKDILLEKNEGRVRPAYWLIQSVASNLSFDNTFLMHLVRIVILLISIYLIYLSLLKIKIDLRWIFFAIFIFLFNFQNFENYYRLGPTEIYLGLYFLIIVYYLFKEKFKKVDYLIVLMVSALGCFTKETFFLVSLPIILLFLSKKVREKKDLKQFFTYVILSNLILGGLVFAIRGSYGEVVGYAQNYQVNLYSIYDHLVNYFKQISHYQSPMISILFWYLIYWFYKNFKNLLKIKENKDLFFIFFIAQVIINLIILLPWQFVLGRYLIIVNISLVFVFAIVLNELSDITQTKLKVSDIKFNLFANLALLSLLPIIFVRNIFPIANFQEWQRTDSDLTTDLLISLSKNIPLNETVFVNYVKGDANVEIFLETKWHLEEFYNRKDISFEYLDEKNLCNLKDRYILDRSSERFVDKEIFFKNKLLLIESKKYTYDPINYGEVLKSFLYGSKSSFWSNSYPFEWSILLQPKNTCLITK